MCKPGASILYNGMPELETEFIGTQRIAVIQEVIRLLNSAGRGGLMRNEQFDELLNSMYEMDRIVQGELAPGRVTRFTEPDIKQVRMNTGLSQKQFAAMTDVSKHLRRCHDRAQH